MTDSQRNNAMTGIFAVSCLGMLVIYACAAWAGIRYTRKMQDRLASAVFAKPEADADGIRPETLDG